MDNLPQDSPSRLFGVMFQHVHCQSHIRQDRKKIYLIFESLLRNRSGDLKAMGPDFVYDVISAMDGEKDPRNLMFLFNMLPYFIKEFPLGHLTEEMFEVIACYFPVDFETTAGKELDITRDAITKALVSCLCAIPQFAEFCIPLITEKLDSDLKLAKLDSLYLLSKGASTFGVDGLKNHLQELWPVLRKEVMSNGDPQIKNTGLEALRELVKALHSNSTVRQSFVEKIITDTRGSLCDVQLSLYWPAEKVLESVATADKDSCIQVLRAIVPLCLGQYSSKTATSDKVALIETLNSFIAISESYNFTIGSLPELTWTDIPYLYLNELTTQDTELKKKILFGLTVQKRSLNELHRTSLYDRISSEIERMNNEIRGVCHTSLLSFGQLYPNEILSVINNKLSVDIDSVESAVITCRLEALTAVARVPELGPEVLAKIVAVATSNNSEKSLAALSCLRKLVSTRNNDFDIHSFLYKEYNAIDRLVTSETGDFNQRLNLISNICRFIVRQLDVEDQQAVVNRYTDILINKISENNVVLLEGLLTPLRRNVYIQNSDTLLENLCNLAICSTSVDARRVSCKLISVLINKMEDGEHLERILNCMRERITDVLESEDSDINTKRATVSLHTWLTKAVITKGSWSSQDYLNYQLNMLRNDRVGYDAALAFTSLADKSEDTLTEENFCNIKIFYKQRIFQNVIQLNSTFDSESRQNYLIAITHLLQEVPHELLFMHLTQLVPLLVESLALDNGELILSTLTTLKFLLKTKNNVFLDQAQAFIPKFLKLSTYKEMKVRITALECLLSYCNYPTISILPFKQDVLDKLATPIDDRKRLVRKVAAQTRTRWFLVGSPGEPK
ncbi:MMS19 nucleotide excision repair protein homolog isoform X2 [Cephus cinctus]|nr:MMS19 nucleotide excision repair protein homolog isoform X2 [Cephus cinctus]XP_024943562.1 MMS19 nucleotide excision repair protein homolog isoform X2 [Cephus cinctus]